MAQTKSNSTKNSTKRSGRARKPQARSRGSTNRSRKSISPGAHKSPAPRSRKSSGTTSRSTSTGKSSSNGASRVEAARHAVGETAKDAGQTVGSAASRAKVPLLAGGAALAGAAGGMVLGARQARRHHRGDLSRAAKDVGSFGAQVGRLASELHQAREATGNGKHRSPVEVVLEGLTARRSR
jgi:hypothetical protein